MGHRFLSADMPDGDAIFSTSGTYGTKLLSQLGLGLSRAYVPLPSAELLLLDAGSLIPVTG